MRRTLLLTVSVALVSGAAGVAPAQAAGAAGTVPPTTPISAAPIAFDRTNGDILAITRVNGAASAELAIGGNFTAVVTPDGISHAARNFAVVDEVTGAVRYAGNVNSYVRAITSRAGTIYLGGDFTAVGSVSRSHLAALGPTFAVTAFNPAPASRVRALAVDSGGVYYGGDGASARKVNLTTGALIWSKALTGGGIKALQLSPDGASIFIGGLFESVGGVVQHGLVKANSATGVVSTAFNAGLKPDSQVGSTGSYDGEAAISFSLTPEGTTIVVGIGGHGSNQVRKLNLTTGATVWRKALVADCQAVVAVGDTYVFGTHRNAANGSIPYPYFGGQIEGSNDALTSWDPKVTGLQSNADGGNNGIQAAYSDPTLKVLFLAGAFTTYNGVRSHQSLIAFTYA